MVLGPDAKWVQIPAPPPSPQAGHFVSLGVSFLNWKWGKLQCLPHKACAKMKQGVCEVPACRVCGGKPWWPCLLPGASPHPSRPPAGQSWRGGELSSPKPGQAASGSEHLNAQEQPCWWEAGEAEEWRGAAAWLPLAVAQGALLSLGVASMTGDRDLSQGLDGSLSPRTCWDPPR